MTDTYILILKHLDSSTLYEFIVEDLSIGNRFVTFEFSENTFKDGSYYYELISENIIYKRGCASYNLI